MIGCGSTNEILRIHIAMELSLRHLWLASHKRDISKQCRQQKVASDQNPHCLQYIHKYLEMSIEHMVTIKTNQILFISS